MMSTFRGSLSRVMNRLPVGECRSCGAEISYFTRRCLHCGAANLPNPVATAAALVAVLLIGGLSARGVVAFRSAGSPKTTAQTAAPTTGAPATSATPDEADGDYGWIVKAMAECEEEAKLKTDTLHFLIVPVTTTATTIMGWSPVPISPIGESAVLLNSTDTLIGLRNRVLALYRKPLTFAVSDPATQTTYKWRPAVGVTALKTRETGSTSLTLGFEIQDVSKDVEWGPTINLGKGSCYWINPLVRPRAHGG
jgi:hypothetical protein